MSEKAMVLFSGGVDSTTCLGLAIEKYGVQNVIPLSVQYGQKHEKEVEAARRILEYYGIEGMELDLIRTVSQWAVFGLRREYRTVERMFLYLLWSSQG